VRDHLLVDLEAVSPRGTAQSFGVGAEVVLPTVELSIDLQLYLVCGVPAADVADSEPDNYLVVVEREAGESFLNEVASHVLT